MKLKLFVTLLNDFRLLMVKDFNYPVSITIPDKTDSKTSRLYVYSLFRNFSYHQTKDL